MACSSGGRFFYESLIPNDTKPDTFSRAGIYPFRCGCPQLDGQNEVWTTISNREGVTEVLINREREVFLEPRPVLSELKTTG